MNQYKFINVWGLAYKLENPVILTTLIRSKLTT